MGIKLNVSDTTGEISATLKTEEKEISNSTFKLQESYTINTLADIPDANFGDVSEFYSSKKKSIVFRKGADVLEVDLSNYDTQAPTYDDPDTWKITQTNEDNVITFNVKDDISGVKEIRYAYLEKYTGDGDDCGTQYYYKDVEVLDASFIKARGKKATISSEGEAVLKVPRDIAAIQIVAIDKAGNYPIDIEKGNGIFYVVKKDYVGCKLKSISSTGLTFYALFNSKATGNYIAEYNVSVSTDGKNYTAPITKTSSGTLQSLKDLVEDYKTGITIADKVYVKIVGTFKNTTDVNVVNNIEKIFEFSLNDGNSDSGVEVNPPVYDEEVMIPVDYSKGDWVKADKTNKNNSWYNYDTDYKKWPNVVTVKETGGTKTRKEYIDAPIGTVINKDDIINTYVWIPRYAYSITNGVYRNASYVSDDLKEECVEIEWLKGNSNVGYNGVEYPTNYDETTLAKGDTTPMIVHPAFQNNIEMGGWDKELTGFWIDKYKITKGGTGGDSFGYDIEGALLKVNTNSRADEGFSTEKEDIHLQKDTEACAYEFLQYSKYGKISDSGEYIKNPSEKYGSISVSSTNNVYGVYYSRGYSGSYGTNTSNPTTYSAAYIIIKYYNNYWTLKNGINSNDTHNTPYKSKNYGVTVFSENSTKYEHVYQVKDKQYNTIDDYSSITSSKGNFHYEWDGRDGSEYSKAFFGNSGYDSSCAYAIRCVLICE